jgi:AsmA protein
MLRKIVLVLFILIGLLVLAIVSAALLVDPDDYREELAAKASEQLGREVRLEGPIDLKYFPWLALDIRDVSVGNPPGLEDAPDLAEIRRATASIRVWPLLRGELEVGAIGIEEAAINLVSSSGGRSNLEGLFEASQTDRAADKPTDLSGLQTGAVSFDNVVLSLIDLAEDSRTDIRLDSMRLDPFAAGREVGVSFSGSISSGDGETQLVLSLDGDLRVAADLSEIALTNWHLDYELPAGEATGQATGNLRLRPEATPVSVELTDFESALAMAGLELTLHADEPIRAVLGELLRIELPAARLGLNGQELKLDGEAALGERLNARLSVSGDRLDLTRLTAGGQGDGGETDAESAGGPEDSAFEFLELSFALELGELVLAKGMTLTEVSARSRLSNGLLTLDPLTARLFGGRFEGSARVDFTQQPPEVILTPSLSGIRVGQLAALLTGQSPVDGEGEMTLDVRFRGFDPQQMLGSLNGNGDFAIAEGVLQGVDLKALIEQELTTDNLASISRAFGGETRFNTLSGGLSIEGGVVELPDLNMAAAGYAASGSGRMDLAAGMVDYRLELDLGEELTARLPRALRRATEGRIPLAISGELMRPTVTVDLASIAEKAVRDEVGRRLLEALESDDDDPEPEAESGGEPEVDEIDGEVAEEEAEGRSTERREARRNLLRDLMGSDRDDDEEDQADEEKSVSESAESQEESETDPPLHL